MYSSSSSSSSHLFISYRLIPSHLISYHILSFQIISYHQKKKQAPRGWGRSRQRLQRSRPRVTGPFLGSAIARRRSSDLLRRAGAEGDVFTLQEREGGWQAEHAQLVETTRFGQPSPSRVSGSPHHVGCTRASEERRSSTPWASRVHQDVFGASRRPDTGRAGRVGDDMSRGRLFLFATKGMMEVWWRTSDITKGERGRLCALPAPRGLLHEESACAPRSGMLNISVPFSTLHAPQKRGAARHVGPSRTSRSPTTLRREEQEEGVLRVTKVSMALLSKSPDESSQKYERPRSLASSVSHGTLSHECPHFLSAQYCFHRVPPALRAHEHALNGHRLRHDLGGRFTIDR